MNYMAANAVFTCHSSTCGLCTEMAGVPDTGFMESRQLYLLNTVPYLNQSSND